MDKVSVEIPELIEHSKGGGEIPPVDMLNVYADARRIRGQVIEDVHQNTLGQVD
jgi:hypothetical protein